MSVKPGSRTYSPDEVRSLRKRAGYTQAELAQVLGVAPSTIHQWEVDRNKSYAHVPTGLSVVMLRNFETWLNEQGL